MKKLNYKLISLVIGLIAISGLAVYYVFATWAPPTAAPPVPNVPRPINVITTTQAFLGSKRIDAALPANVLSLGPGLGVDGVLHAGSNLIVVGNVGIGTTAPQTRLDVAGAIRVGSQDICNAANAGAIRFISTVGAERFEGCNGVRWRLIAYVREEVVKRVFVTSSRHTGNLGGLAGADSICMARASAAGLPGTWRALLSNDAVHARDRIHYNWHRLVTMDGRTIATSKADLWKGNITNLINRSELGAVVNGSVWSGTDEFGFRSPVNSNCINWTFGHEWADITGLYGRTTYTAAGWIRLVRRSCALSNHIYCVEQ